MSKAERRAERAKSRRGASESVRMAPFVRGTSPAECGYGNGWLAEMDGAWTNDWFAVLARTIDTAVGRVIHLAIRDAPNGDISWADKMWIKDQIAGSAAYAVEVFPARDRLIDEANMYHLWVLPQPLPFGIHAKDDGQPAATAGSIPDPRPSRSWPGTAPLRNANPWGGLR